MRARTGTQIRLCHRCPARNAFRLRSISGLWLDPLPPTRPMIPSASSSQAPPGGLCSMSTTRGHIREIRSLGSSFGSRWCWPRRTCSSRACHRFKETLAYHERHPSPGRPATLCHLPVLSRAEKLPAAASRSRPHFQCVSRKTHHQQDQVFSPAQSDARFDPLCRPPLNPPPLRGSFVKSQAPFLPRPGNRLDGRITVFF